MSWTQPADLRAQLLKLWERGDLLASQVTAAPLFPKRLALKTPTSNDMTEQFDAVRAWSRDYARALRLLRVVMRESSGIGCWALIRSAPMRFGSTRSMTRLTACIGKQRKVFTICGR